jgi:hypothetical protein
MRASSEVTGDGGSVFLGDSDSTVMSILHGVSGETQSREKMERFCLTYTEPLIEFLARSKRMARDAAHDLVNDFWLAKMLDIPPPFNLVAKYLTALQTNQESSFRRYLSASLNNFYLSKTRTKKDKLLRAQRSLDDIDGWEPSVQHEMREFDILWANHLLSLVLEKVRSECENAEHFVKWQVFLRLIVQPCIENGNRPTYSEVANTLGLSSPKEVSNALTTFKRIFMRHFSIAVQDYLPARNASESLAGARSEVEEILLELSRAGSLRLPLENWGIHVASTGESQWALQIDSYSGHSLFRSSEDFALAWRSLKTADLTEILEFPSAGEPHTVTIDNMVTGTIVLRDTLNKVRGQAKRMGSDTGASGQPMELPRRLYALIYLIAIASGDIYLETQISRQSRPQLLENAIRFVGESWLDDVTKSFLHVYIERLKQN